MESRRVLARSLDLIGGTTLVLGLGLAGLAFAVDLYEQTEIPKRVALNLTLGVAAAAYLASRAVDTRRSNVTSFGFTEWVALTYLIWSLVITPFAVSKALSLNSLHQTFEWVVALFLMRSYGQSVGLCRIFIFLWALAGLAAAFFGLWHFDQLHPSAFPGVLPSLRQVFDSWRADPGILTPLLSIRQTDAPGSFFGHTNAAAEFLVPHAAFFLIAGAGALQRAWRDDRPFLFLKGVLGLCVAAPSVLMIVRSGSRAVWVGLSVVLVVVFVISQVRRIRHDPWFNSRIRHILSALGLVLTGLTICVLGARELSFEPRSGQPRISVYERVLSTFDPANTTVRERLDLWANTAAMAMAHPVFGVGPGNFAVVYPAYWARIRQHEIGRFTLSRQPESSHSTWLDVAAENGLLGILFWVAFLIGVGWRGVQPRFESDQSMTEHQFIRGALVAAFGALVLTSSFSFPLGYSGTRALFGALAGLILALSPRRGFIQADGSRWSASVALILTCGLGLMVAASLNSRWKASAAFANAFAANALETSSDAFGRLRYLDQAAAREPIRYLYQTARGESARLLRRMEVAERSFDEALRHHPNLINALVGLGSVALDRGILGDDAVFTQAVRLNPLEPSARVNLAAFFDRRGRRESALREYHAALELHPIPPVAVQVHLSLARLYETEGNQLAALWHLQNAQKLAPGDPNVIASAAEILSRQSIDSEPALRLWEQLLQSVPRHSLGNLYVGRLREREGRLSEALAHFEQAFDADPRLITALFERALVLLRLERPAEARDSLFECMKRAAQSPTDKDLWERSRLLVAEIESRFRAAPPSNEDKQ